MLRNKEIRILLAVLTVMTAATSVCGFSLSPAAGWLVLLFACASGGAFFWFTRARYQRIAQLSDQIDRFLHNENRLLIGGAEEGELSILQDEILKMTLRLREQNRSLQREKERLSDSLADIAHQLRTPLTSVNMILSLLPDSPAGQESLRSEAQELLARMDYLLTALLKLSRLDAGIVVFQPVQAEVKQIISDALRPLLIPLDLHGVTVQAEVPDGIPLTCDAGWLAEALRNLLKNCMESAGDGGSIEIRCASTLLYTEITIHDSGAGFAKEDLPRLFHRFYRGQNSSAAGYGIGLALSRSIITGQGGAVSAKNHPEGGALFTVRFPK